MSSLSRNDSVLLMSTLAVKAALVDQIIPRFEETTAYRIDALFDPTNVLQKRITEGQTADVLIATDVYIRRLTSERVVASSTVKPLVKTGVGVAVAWDSPMREIDSVDALRDLLLAARSVAYSKTGASGVYFARLIHELGIAKKIAKRATVIEKGFTGECIKRGTADVAIQQMSELYAVPGIRVLGPLPEEIQAYTDFWIGIFAGGTPSESTVAFVDFMTSAYARAVYQKQGLVVL